ncbi:MAG: Rrf2 family transcriptional regulator [Planctomycetes bacterium]|nr:Rrf2 family transcriptional regulator [Planctomycetota bacterium]
MLRISKKADYAVFLLGAIARAGAYPGGHAGDTVVSAHEIARQAKLNKSVVANLLKEFAKHGLLESTRGLKGGYRLVRAPADISLGDILEIVEGKFVLVDCVAHDRAASLPSGLLALAPSQRSPAARASDHDDHDCALISFCPSKRPMRVVHERISQLFHEIRLDELCSLAPAATPATARR